MQKLLQHNHGTFADPKSFFHEPFLQWSPPNVRMALSSAATSMDLDRLADKVMEVATPAIS